MRVPLSKSGRSLITLYLAPLATQLLTVFVPEAHFRAVVIKKMVLATGSWIIRG